MRVTQRTTDTLVIEEGAGTKVLIASIAAVIGVVFVLIGLKKAETLFVVAGVGAALVGLWMLVFGRTHTHRFDEVRRASLSTRRVFGDRIVERCHSRLLQT